METTTSFFSEEDKDFNRQMVALGDHKSLEEGIAEHSPFHPRNYDFSSEILKDYRKKWNLN